jgi:hypothetical protein
MLAAILGFIALAWRLDRAATWPFRALCRLGGLCGAAERLDLDDELSRRPLLLPSRPMRLITTCCAYDRKDRL